MISLLRISLIIGLIFSAFPCTASVNYLQHLRRFMRVYERFTAEPEAPCGNTLGFFFSPSSCFFSFPTPFHTRTATVWQFVISCGDSTTGPFSLIYSFLLTFPCFKYFHATSLGTGIFVSRKISCTQPKGVPTNHTWRPPPRATGVIYGAIGTSFYWLAGSSEEALPILLEASQGSLWWASLSQGPWLHALSPLSWSSAGLVARVQSWPREYC